MPKFLSAKVIEKAVKNLSESAARGRFFEFLILKRALEISESNSVVFAEGNPAYKQAINELGLVTVEDETKSAESSSRNYINVFDTKDSTHGYRSKRFISNGPNTTVGGTAWQPIVQIDQSRPRKVCLVERYVDHISKFLLLKNGDKPSFYAFAIWYYRHVDIENLVDSNMLNFTEVVVSLAKHTDLSFGFTNEEKSVLFDVSNVFYDTVASLDLSALQNKIAISNDYLPSIPEVLIDTKLDSDHVAPPVFSTSGPYQKVYFGAPGSGKSRRLSLDSKSMKVFRTTFHPDSEYAGFVGVYKPFVSGKDITYAFVPQIFTKAYVYAWKHPRELVCLAIDEINRGNCAQIFGDLFQLLDRNEIGFSEYALLADADLVAYLEENITNTADYTALTGGIDQLKLPPNLYLYATMNTSDQSLFPMDSAFKRRWDWEYVPIDYTDANQFTIVLSNDYTYKWGNFIECVNRFIVELTGSEDKQLGNRFVNPNDKVVTLSMFKSKVLYYLWSEIYKNESDKATNIFVYQPADAPDIELFSFSRLYEKRSDETPLDLEILPSFMRQLGLEPTRL